MSYELTSEFWTNKPKQKKATSDTFHFKMWFLTFCKKSYLFVYIFCLGTTCKLSCGSSMVFFSYFTLAYRAKRWEAACCSFPDSSELLRTVMSPVPGGPTVTLTWENKKPEVLVVAYFTQATGEISLMECLYLIQGLIQKRERFCS